MQGWKYSVLWYFDCGNESKKLYKVTAHLGDVSCFSSFNINTTSTGENIFNSRCFVKLESSPLQSVRLSQETGVLKSSLYMQPQNDSFETIHSLQ
jgi:hypothetical protein